MVARAMRLQSRIAAAGSRRLQAGSRGSLWFWLWGIAGALLAVPMLQTVKIFCDNIPPLARVGQFLGR
jgi:hypothetical protein